MLRYHTLLFGLVLTVAAAFRAPSPRLPLGLIRSSPTGFGSDSIGSSWRRLCFSRTVAATPGGADGEGSSAAAHAQSLAGAAAAAADRSSVHPSSSSAAAGGGGGGGGGGGAAGAAAAAVAAPHPVALQAHQPPHRQHQQHDAAGRGGRRRGLVDALKGSWTKLITPQEYDQEIWNLALPTLGAVLIDPMLSLVDTMFVGKLGHVSLAAMGPCTALYNFIFATASCMFSVSTAVLVARYKALDDATATGRTLFTAAGSSLVLGLFFTVLMASRPAQALRLMGASSPEMVRLGAPYLLWRATALPANMFLLVAGGAFRGVGEAKENFTNGLLVGAINLVLDPLLMFTCGLGVGGAAMATAIAQWVGALSYGVKMSRRRAAFGLNQGWAIIPKLQDVQEFLAAGTAMLFRSLCNVGAWTLMASIATRMGVVEIAAHQLILSMWLVIAFVQDAVGAAGQVLVSQQLGSQGAGGRHAVRRGKARARAIAKRVISFSAVIGVVLSVASQLALPALIPLVCSAPEVVALASSVLPIVLLGFPVCCVVWTWDSVFYGASDFKYNAKVIAVSSSIAVSLTLASLHYGWGLIGLWSSMIFAYFGLRVVAHIRRFNSHTGPFGKSTASLLEGMAEGEGAPATTDAGGLAGGVVPVFT